MRLLSITTFPISLTIGVVLLPLMFVTVAVCMIWKWCKTSLYNYQGRYRVDETENIAWPKGVYEQRAIIQDCNYEEDIAQVLSLASEYRACPQIKRGYKMIAVRTRAGQYEFIPQLDSLIVAFEDKTQAMLFKLAYGSA